MFKKAFNVAGSLWQAVFRVYMLVYLCKYVQAGNEVKGGM